MKVKSLIAQLNECNPEADVFNVLFDTDTNGMSLVLGIDNRGAHVALFEKIAWDSKNAQPNTKKHLGYFNPQSH